MTTKSPNGISRRTLLAAAGATAAIGGLAAPSVHAQSNKTIRFLNNETSIDTLRALRVAAAEYEKQFGVKVVIDSATTEDTFTKLTTSIRGGQPYDIATLAFVGHVLILAQEGHLVSLNELTDKYKWGPKILFPIDGKTFWYPYDYNLAWIYYRKDLYEQKKLSVPKDWKTMLANSQALNADGTSGSIFPIGSNPATNWLSLGFMWADGVTLLDDKFNVSLDSAENTPRVIAYLDFFADLYKTMPSGVSQASFGEVISNFVSGKVGHAPYAGRIIETLEKNAPALTTKYGIMPYMDKDGKAVAVNHGYDGWVVTKSGNSEEAIKFMKWFTETQYINYLHTAPLHFQPPRLDVYEDPRWRAHPLIEKHKEAVDTIQGFITDPKMIIRSVDTEGPKPDLRPGKVFEAYVLPEMLQNRVLKNMSSAECLKIAADKARALVKV